MKKFTKLLGIVLIIALVMSMGITAAFAGDPVTPAEPATPAADTLADGSIKITPPSGVDANATNTYNVYKVFDATNNGTAISYKVMASKTGVPNVAAQYTGDTTFDATTHPHFSVDAGGNVRYGTIAADGTFTASDTLTAEAIAAIAAYVAGDTPVASPTATGTAATTATGLGAGYYYITTTTGTVVTIDSTNPSADVIDKNSVPGVDKKITGATSIDADGKKALAQVGTDVTYTAEITVGTGAKGYIFHDTMETGLTYNNDVKVYIGETEVAASNYEINKDGDKLAADTFSVSFKDDYTKALASGTVLKVVYSAKVNNDAITVDPLNNTCYVSYGDKNSNNKTPTSEADVYEAKFTVTKKDGNGDPLEGAGFVIKNASGAYYKLTPGQDATAAQGTEGEEGYVPAQPATNPTVSWYTLGAEETLEQAITAGKVTEYKSNAQGAVTSFTGLANGTYTLVESTVPAGYNKAADYEFTIAEHSYTAANLEQATDVTNQSGTELPSTGGIGTTIFYVVGSIMVVAAGVLLVTKKRMSREG